MCKRKKNFYLKTNRLADVLALIQVLALDKDSHRSESGLKTEFKVNPKSAESWKEVAEEHPEFFRVSEENTYNISLISRHVTPKTDNIRNLPEGFLGKLMETAIELHDKQLKRFEQWKIWTPIIAVILSGGISILVAVLKCDCSTIGVKDNKIEVIIKNDATTMYKNNSRDSANFKASQPALKQ